MSLLSLFLRNALYVRKKCDMKSHLLILWYGSKLHQICVSAFTAERSPVKEVVMNSWMSCIVPKTADYREMSHTVHLPTHHGVNVLIICQM